MDDATRLTLLRALADWMGTNPALGESATFYHDYTDYVFSVFLSRDSQTPERCYSADDTDGGPVLAVTFHNEEN